MFSKLPALPNLSPNQTKQAQALAKNFSARKKTDLEKADKLLFDLFIADNTAAVAICLDVLTARRGRTRPARAPLRRRVHRIEL